MQSILTEKKIYILGMYEVKRIKMRNTIFEF